MNLYWWRRAFGSRISEEREQNFSFIQILPLLWQEPMTERQLGIPTGACAGTQKASIGLDLPLISFAKVIQFENAKAY